MWRVELGPNHHGLCLGERIGIFVVVWRVWGSDSRGLISSFGFIFLLYLFSVCVCDKHAQVPSETTTRGSWSYRQL